MYSFTPLQQHIHDRQWRCIVQDRDIDEWLLTEREGGGGLYSAFHGRRRRTLIATGPSESSSTSCQWYVTSLLCFSHTSFCGSRSIITFFYFLYCPWIHTTSNLINSDWWYSKLGVFEQGMGVDVGLNREGIVKGYVWYNDKNMIWQIKRDCKIEGDSDPSLRSIIWWWSTTWSRWKDKSNASYGMEIGLRRRRFRINLI